jgi:hypothetical protein
MLLSVIYAIVVAVILVISIVILYVLDKMKRGIDPMPAFVAALMTQKVISKIANNVGQIVSNNVDKLSQPLGYRYATTEDTTSLPLNLPGIFVNPDTNITLPGLFPSEKSA